MDFGSVEDYSARVSRELCGALNQGPVSYVGAGVTRRSNESLCADNFFLAACYSTVTDFARLRG